MARFRSESTPNPNSLKITRRKGKFIDSGLLSYASGEEAGAHPLAAALFGLEGVTNVLILPDFLTVTKSPGTPWIPLWKEIERTLEAHYD